MTKKQTLSPVTLAEAIGKELSNNTANVLKLAECKLAVEQAKKDLSATGKTIRGVESNININIKEYRKGNHAAGTVYLDPAGKRVARNNLFVFKQDENGKPYSKVSKRSDKFQEIVSEKCLDTALETFLDVEKCSKFGFALILTALKTGGSFDTAVKHAGEIAKLCEAKEGRFSFNKKKVTEPDLTFTITRDDILDILSGKTKTSYGQMVIDAGISKLDTIGKFISTFSTNDQKKLEKWFAEQGK